MDFLRKSSVLEKQREPNPVTDRLIEVQGFEGLGQGNRNAVVVGVDVATGQTVRASIHDAAAKRPIDEEAARKGAFVGNRVDQKMQEAFPVGSRMCLEKTQVSGEEKDGAIRLVVGWVGGAPANPEKSMAGVYTIAGVRSAKTEKGESVQVARRVNYYGVTPQGHTLEDYEAKYGAEHTKLNTAWMERADVVASTQEATKGMPPADSDAAWNAALKDYPVKPGAGVNFRVTTPEGVPLAMSQVHILPLEQVGQAVEWLQDQFKEQNGRVDIIPCKVFVGGSGAIVREKGPQRTMVETTASAGIPGMNGEPLVVDGVLAVRGVILLSPGKYNERTRSMVGEEHDRANHIFGCAKKEPLVALALLPDGSKPQFDAENSPLKLNYPNAAPAAPEKDARNEAAQDNADKQPPAPAPEKQESAPPSDPPPRRFQRGGGAPGR